MPARRRPARSAAAGEAPKSLAERPSIQAFRQTSIGELFWDLLTFDRLLTGPVTHLIYWSGLAILVLAGFAVIGGAVGVALREGGLMAWLLAVPVLVTGLLALAAATLLWRSFCELYVAIFRISADLRALREASERTGAPIYASSLGASPSEAPEPGTGEKPVG